MKDHYGFTDGQYSTLVGSGVTILDMVQSVKLFDPQATGQELSKINIYHYVDAKGDFNAPPTKLKHKLIAKAFFNSLEITMKERLEILQYIDDASSDFKNLEE